LKFHHWFICAKTMIMRSVIFHVLHIYLFSFKMSACSFL